MKFEEQELTLLGKKAKYKKLEDEHTYTSIRFPFKAEVQLKVDKGDVVAATWTLYVYTGAPHSFGGLFGGGGDGALGTQSYVQSPQSVEEDGEGLDPQKFIDKCVEELEKVVDAQCQNLAYYLSRVTSKQVKEKEEEAPQKQG